MILFALSIGAVFSIPNQNFEIWMQKYGKSYKNAAEQGQGFSKNIFKNIFFNFLSINPE